MTLKKCIINTCQSMVGRCTLCWKNGKRCASRFLPRHNKNLRLNVDFELLGHLVK